MGGLMLTHQHSCYNGSGLTGCVTTPPVLTATFLCERIVMADESLPKTARAAKAAGEKFFFTGNPCKRGHVEKRRASDRKCVACVLEKGREKYAADPTTKLASALRWKNANRPHIAAYMHDYNTANAERISEAKKRCYRAKHEQYRLRQRAYWHANKAEFMAQNRQWHQENADRSRLHKRLWSRAHPDYNVMRASLRRAAIRKRTPVWLSADQIAATQVFFEEARRLTAETGIPHEVDHIVPLLGENVCGLHVPWNLQVLTEFANRSKGNKHGD